MAAAAARHRTAYQGVACPFCDKGLDHTTLASGPQSCPQCRRGFEAVVFHPVEARPAVAEVAAAGPTGVTPCANHARNVAVAACERCGRFMCELCRIDSDGKTLCPGCFERLSGEGALQSTVTRFRDYSALTASYVAAGAVILFLAPLTAPLALVYGRRALREKRERGESDGIIKLRILMGIAVVELLGAVAVYSSIIFQVLR